jgi:hypothetical protein
VLRLVERRGAGGDALDRVQALGDGAVDALGVDLPDLGTLLLVAELVPDGDADVRGHVFLHGIGAIMDIARTGSTPC